MKEFVVEGQDLVVFTSHKYVVVASSAEEAKEKIQAQKPNFSVRKVYETCN